MSVQDMIHEQDEVAAHMWRFVLWPRKWQEHAITACEWQVHKLKATESPQIPNEPGIYALLIQPGIAGHPALSYLMYVGQTVSLHRRFGDYLGRERREAGRPKIFRLLQKWDDYIWFSFTPLSAESLNDMEDALINACMPPCNDQLPAEISRVMGAF